VTDPTPNEAQLTAGDLAHALRHTPAAHVDLRRNLNLPEPEVTNDKAALRMIEVNEPTTRHAVAYFLVHLRHCTQEQAFAIIKKLIAERNVIEVDGELMAADGRKADESPKSGADWLLILTFILLAATVALGGWLIGRG
jgi:hypothetical protein